MKKKKLKYVVREKQRGMVGRSDVRVMSERNIYVIKRGIWLSRLLSYRIWNNSERPTKHFSLESQSGCGLLKDQ